MQRRKSKVLNENNTSIVSADKSAVEYNSNNFVDDERSASRLTPDEFNESQRYNSRSYSKIENLSHKDHTDNLTPKKREATTVVSNRRLMVHWPEVKMIQYTMFALLLYVATHSVQESHQQQISSSNRKGLEPMQLLPTCIDDGDCKSLGSVKGQPKFRCMKYVCYPWMDDSEIASSERKQTCRSSKDCPIDHTCWRHNNFREVYRGLCFEKSEQCERDSDCGNSGQKKEFSCCGIHCCENKYHTTFKQLPCETDFGCQDFFLGQFCCPGKSANSTSVCCDVNPNPPPAENPKHSKSHNGAFTLRSHVSVVQSIFVVALLACSAAVLLK